MDVHHQIDRLPPPARGAVVAIGNFDGVHLGHRAVIGQARAQADALKVPLAVMTFEPHPRAFFQPATPPFRLTPAAAKARELAALGVDHLYVVGFDRAFAAIPAHDFVAKVLAEQLGAVCVVVGGDFHFGRGRQGDIDFLEREAAALGIRISRVMPVMTDSDPVASRSIREHLSRGDLDAAARLLGRPWEMEGPVVHGDKLGRTIGYPTANVDLGDMLRPRVGIYAVEALVEGEDLVSGKPDVSGKPNWRGGVASLGYRPTVGGRDLRFEVHLFDFAGDLYDRTLRVRPVAYLRDELALDGLEALTRKIKEDEQQARAVLARAAVAAGAADHTKSARPGGR
jgi:riboflavin kinase/FMN adenylyltransferase